MQYSKQFGSDNHHYEGELILDYPSTHGSDPQYVDAEILLTPSIKNDSDVKIRIERDNGSLISPSIIEKSGGQISQELEIFIHNDVNGINFNIIVETTNEEYSDEFEVTFDDLELLMIGDKLFDEANFNSVSFRNRINTYTEDSGRVWPLINFASNLSEYTTFGKFLEIIEIYTENYDEIEEKKQSIFETILKRALLGKIGNGRHHMRRLSEFEAGLNDIINTFGPRSVDPTKSLRYTFEEFDNNEELGGIIQLARELQIVDLYPEAINEKTFYILLGEEIKRQSEEGARNLVDQFFESHDDKFEFEIYQERKEKAKDLTDDIKAQSEWFDLLSYAQTSLESHDFKHLIATFLYWTASKNSGDPSYYYVVPELYEATGKWFDQLDIRGFNQRSDYESNYRRGLYFYHNNDHQKASREFQSALSICTNETREYERPRPKWMQFPIIYKSLADAEHLIEQNKQKEAAELLENRKEDIEELKILTESTKDKILSSIGAERFRVLANILLKEGNYERAKELLEQSISMFKQSDFDTSFEITLLKKLEVEAVILEVNGEFKKASNKHQQIANDGRYSNSKQYLHTIRADICDIKVETRNKEYDKALDIIKKVNRSTDELYQESRQLGILLRVLSNYEADEVSDVREAIENLSTDTISKSEHPLDVEFDYIEPLVVVLAMERLNQTDLPEPLLDSILELSVERALTPKQDTGVVEESYIGDISIDRLWRERLPSIVLNRVEKIQIDSVSIPGGYKGVTLLLAELVEFYMALLIEYHGKKYWGDSWRSELTEDDQDEDNLTIGTLARILNSEAAENIENSNVLEAIYYDSREDFDNLTSMRNRYDHAYEGSVSERQFEELKDWVFEFLRESVQDSPIIISIGGGNDFNLYQVRVHWWRGQRKIGLETQADLDKGAFYYIPADSILGPNEQVSYKVDESDIYEVDDARVRKQIKELPKYNEGSES
jgi:hypothetical protein